MGQFFSALKKLIAAAPAFFPEGVFPVDKAALGKGEGLEEALHFLYDHVLDEPVPPRLAAMPRRHERSNKS